MKFKFQQFYLQSAGIYFFNIKNFYFIFTILVHPQIWPNYTLYISVHWTYVTVYIYELDATSSVSGIIHEFVAIGKQVIAKMRIFLLFDL